MHFFRFQILAVLASSFAHNVLAFSDLHHGAHHHHADHLEKRLLGLLEGNDGLLGLLEGKDDLLGVLGSNNGPLDVSGEHEWRAPGPEDQRGPCPGLNAMANHGYIPRDGIVGLLEVIPAITRVFGMSIELAALLAVMGTAWSGNLISLNPGFSIGGNDTRVQHVLGNVLGLLGEPRGIDHSHNFIEADSSPTRNDLYVTGDPVTMNLTNFERLYDLVPEGSGGVFSLEVLTDWAAIRFNDSIATNPYFYYGPISGLIARNAGFNFIGNLFGNHTDGKNELTHDILKSFFAVSGDRDNFTYTKGHERIPENWYKTQTPYSLVQLNLDTVGMVLRYPRLGSLGGNIGGVNSFSGIDLANPVDGVLGLTNLLEGNNLLCFALELVTFASPNYLNNPVSTLVGPLKSLTDALAVPLLNLGCPQLGEITRDGVPLWESLGAQFPGANRTGIPL